MPFTYKVQKGDTLNSIANRYGFSNYKQAGITSVPSGNFDLIRPDEEITLSNYNPSEVSTIGSTSPVISSKDNAQQFNEDSSLLDNIVNGTTAGTQTKDETTTAVEGDQTKKDITPFATGQEKTKDGVTTIETTGDPILDKLNKWEQEQTAKFDLEAETRKQAYKDLYTTSLSAIDKTAQDTIDRINLSYDKRIEEQKRLNKLNVDRTKAYGLSGGGRFVPIQFGDAISQREEEGADKVANLDNQRNQLIAEAKSARDAGESKLLREKLEDLDKVDTQLRNQLADIEKEAEAQYKLLRDIRKEEETKHKEAVDKMLKNLQSIAPQYADEYDKLSDEEKDKFIDKLVKQTGLDYASVYATMESAVAGVLDQQLDTKKKEADIEASKALTKQREASAYKSFADAGVKSQETKDKQTMLNDVPDTFASEEDFTKQREEFVRKYGVEGQKHWDAVFNKDDVGDYTYTIDAKAGTGDRVTVVSPDGTEGTIPKEQLAEALKAGYKQK